MKTISTSITIDTISYYAANFKNLFTGTRSILEGIPSLRDDAVRNMQGIFSLVEIDFLYHVDQGKKIEPKQLASRRNWEASIADYYDESSGMYKDLSIKNLLTKMRKTHSFDLFIARELLNNKKYTWDELKLIFIQSS